MTSAKVWALDRRVFQQVMKKTGLQRIDDNLKFLRSVPLFERLTTDHMSKIADVLEVVSRLSKPAPFCYVYLCCGGGGRLSILARVPASPIFPHGRISSPLISWISDCSVFPVVIAKKETIKTSSIYPVSYQKARGIWILFFFFRLVERSAWSPSQTGAHRSPALT